jgi:hypothetical protein
MRKRKLKPDEQMPVHVMTLREPHTGKVTEFKTYPIDPISGHYYCKYCDTRHRRWWLLEKGDPREEDIILCPCGYSSMKVYAL